MKKTKTIIEKIQHYISDEEIETILKNHFRSIDDSKIDIDFDCYYSGALKGANIVETVTKVIEE